MCKSLTYPIHSCDKLEQNSKATNVCYFHFKLNDRWHYWSWSFTSVFPFTSPGWDHLYTCQLFFSKMCEILHLHRTWISEHLPTAPEDCQRFPKTSKDCGRFLMTSEDCRLPKITDCVERFSTNSKQDSPQLFFTKKKKWIFTQSVFKQLHSLLSVGREKLVWMREITILDLQAWDSRIMCES